MDHLYDLIQRIDRKLDKQDEKLDNIAERFAKTETIAERNSGWIKIIVTTIIGIVGSIVTYVMRELIK